MRTIQTQVTVNQDHVLNLTLPEDITEGTYQRKVLGFRC